MFFFFLFLVVSNIFFVIIVVKKNARLKFTFAIPTGTPAALLKEIIDIPPLVADKIIRILSKESKAYQMYLCSFLLIVSLS